MRALVLLVAAAVGGCALKPPIDGARLVDEALPQGTRVPGAWKAGAGAAQVDDDWLRTFDDPLLDAIVREAIANNLDLRQAAERVRVAQQKVIVVGAQLLPQVGAQLGASTVRDKDQDSDFNSTVAYVGVAWELDIWGRLRASRAATEAAYQATALDYAFARQSLAALTAKTWYLAIETRQLVALAEQAVKVYSGLLGLVQIRRSAGKDTDLDVVETRARVESAQADLQAAREAYGESRRALEVLLGRYPAAEIEVASAYPRLPPPVRAGVPAAVLKRRPDLVAAEQTVLAAFRQHEAAELALLPDFSLSIAGGRLGDQVLSLLRLNPWFATAGIGVSIPIFEGGALRAKVEIATAQQAQAVAQYGAAALTAFREAENALANEQLLAYQVPYTTKALADRTSAVEIATVQYRAGRRDLLWVAQLQAQQLATQAVLIKLQSAQGANRIRLHLALGGSYDSVPAVAPSEQAVPR